MADDDDLRKVLRDFRASVSREFEEVHAEIAELRSEISGVQGEVGGLRGEVIDLRGEVGGLRGEVIDIRVLIGDLGTAVMTELRSLSQTMTNRFDLVERRLDRLEGGPNGHAA